jgi:hypothetical protein
MIIVAIIKEETWEQEYRLKKEFFMLEDSEECSKKYAFAENLL